MLNTVAIAPLLPIWSIAALAICGGVLLTLAFRMRLPLMARLGCLLVLVTALLNPEILRTQATAVGDIALLLVDDSPSMQLGQRPAETERAVASLQKKLAALPNLETRVLRVGGDRMKKDGTRLFAAMADGLADIPASRLAGVIMLTDGQVHDVPDKIGIGAPLQVLLAGSRQDRDRRLVIEQSPSFGMVGNDATLAFHIEDPGHDGRTDLTMRRDGHAESVISVPLNQSTRLTVPISHAGANVIELDAAAAPGELTLLNNRAVVSISGVRDRLRVLLLSGEPHPGERMWRNLLKADPAVDLVHFTILRSPDNDDRTPVQQLSLIPFPTRELFEEKLKDFDLIIVDRFRRSAILPSAYYHNIATHVRDGGALLLVAGPELGAAESPIGNALAEILPAKPDGRVLSTAFLPMVTPLGLRHPLFQGLPGAESQPPHWGRWVRAAGSTPDASAETLMATPDGMPLLLVAHAGDGRVAQLNSDSAWLWGRNWDGGGPQAELLRRLAHWLMKEPQLEEDRLDGQSVDGKLRITRRSLDLDDHVVTVTAPDGSATPVTLTSQGHGQAIGMIETTEDGLWRIAEGSLTSLVSVGAPDTLEMSDVRATATKLQPAVTASQGGLFWLEDGLPAVVRQPAGAQMAGSGWFALRANHQQSVTTSSSVPLLPGWLLLALAVGGLILAWWQESRQ